MAYITTRSRSLASGGSGSSNSRSTRTTFFIESWNLHVYPDAVRSVVEAGHEIGCHGMRHEIWCNLTAEQELDHLKR